MLTVYTFRSIREIKVLRSWTSGKLTRARRSAIESVSISAWIGHQTEMILEIIVAILSPILLYILFDYVHHLLQLHKFPPGPFPYPGVGNVRQLFRGSQHENLAKLSEKYGDICSFSFVNKRAVLISDIDVAREVLIRNGEKVSGRLQDHYIGQIMTKRHDLVAAEGDRWKRLRKMAHSSLQMYGYGMDRLEGMIINESVHFHQRLRNLNGAAVDPKLHLALFFMNVTCALMFGDRYDENDPEFADILEFQNLINLASGAKEVVAFFPFLRIFPIFKSIKYAKKAIALRDPIFNRKIREHEATFDAANIRDFTDSLINYVREQKEQGGEIHDDDILMMLHDFVFAGVDTGLNTLGFGILYLVHHPQCQQQIISEMDAVLGEGEYPTLKDRPRLPFLHATTMEILRRSSVAFLGLPHRVLSDFKVGKHTLHKNTVLFYNAWKINHDERHWKNPHAFDPSRWLDDKGGVKLGGKESYIAFGLGRRNCVGETLAKAELFVVLGRLIRDFEFAPPEDGRLPSLDPDVDFLLHPKPSAIRFLSR